MAGFRQEDVELYYEMGEELGRYVTLSSEDAESVTNTQKTLLTLDCNIPQVLG